MTGTSQERAERYERAKMLWLNGCTYLEIGHRLGIHQATVHKIVSRNLIVDCQIPYDLTPTEIEICKLLIAGKNNPRIAVIRKITLKTANCHIQNIYRKLNIESEPGICKRVIAVIKLKELEKLF